MSISVAITDDHPLIIDGLKTMLHNVPGIEVVATYSGGAELLQGLRQHVPDILLLDIHMPGIQGDELARIIQKDFPGLRVIALTNTDQIYYIKSMMQRGVSGYLLKHIKREQLISAIREVYAGNEFLDETIRERIAEERENIRRQTAHGDMLTQRQKEILQLIAESCTSREIAEKLCLSKRTVDHHRERIFIKMEVKNVSALIKKALELGLVNI